MIIVIALLWFSVLAGMEQEMPVQLVQKEPAWIPSLLAVAQRAVCSHVVNKKITIKDVQKFPPDEQDLIQSLIKSAPGECLLNYEDIDHYYLDTITPDHRYMLARGAEGIVRLDLVTNEKIIVADSNMLALEESRDVQSYDSLYDLYANSVRSSLSTSGNVAVFAAPEPQKGWIRKWWIKDILQNKVIIEQKMERRAAFGISFIGKEYLFIREGCGGGGGIWSIEKEELKMRSSAYVWMAVLPAAGEYIAFANGGFLRATFEGPVTNQTQVKNLENLEDEDLFWVKPVFYEPDVLIAYTYTQYTDKKKDKEAISENIEIVSLKDWPEVATPSARFQCDMKVNVLAFAHKGEWLIVGGGVWGEDYNEVRDGKIIILKWQRKQQLYTHKYRDQIFDISYTDCLAPYPCLFQTMGLTPASSNAIHSFDPIKAVAAGMLFPPQLQKTAATAKRRPTVSTKVDKRCIVS